MLPWPFKSYPKRNNDQPQEGGCYLRKKEKEGLELVKERNPPTKKFKKSNERIRLEIELILQIQ
jgi:hypothetical protein